MEITAEFLAGMPKAELHVHLEGTLEPEMMLRTARSNGVELPWKTVEEVRSAYRFGSLEAFLSVLFRVGQVLAQDFYDLTVAYLRQAAEESVVREMFFGARTFLDLGVPISEQLAARSTRWTYSSSSIRGLTASSGLASGPLNLAIRPG